MGPWVQIPPSPPKDTAPLYANWQSRAVSNAAGCGFESHLGYQTWRAQMLICKFCESVRKNENSLRNHERMCAQNPAKQLSPFVEYHQSKQDKAPWNKGRSDLGPAWNKGLPGTFAGKKHTAETKKKLAAIMKNRYNDGWESKAGRCKKYEYMSPIAGLVKLDGTWELKVASHLDSLGVEWIRNKERFSYIRPDGKSATYQPDFYVKTWDKYLEVKGYQTALDEAKWRQFPHKLEVWKRDKIETLEGKV